MVISREHDPAGLGASVGDVLGTFLHQPEQGDTSRETIFDPLRNLALVPVVFAPGTRETFSPGC